MLSFFFTKLLLLLLLLILILIILPINLFFFYKKIKNTNDENNNKIKQLEKENDKKTLQIRSLEDEIEIQHKIIKDLETNIKKLNNQLNIIDNYCLKLDELIFKTDYLTNFLNNSFIVSIPREKNNTDFFYVLQQKEYVIAFLADLSDDKYKSFAEKILLYDSLNKIFTTQAITKPSDILNSLLKLIYINKDFIDNFNLSIISINKFYKLVEFAGINRSIFYTHKGKIIEVKGDKYLGTENLDSFGVNNYAIPVSEGDMIYMYSDGFVNQVCGTSILSQTNFSDLLLKVSNNNLTEQRDTIIQLFNDWKKDNKQINDVLIVGIKL